WPSDRRFPAVLVMERTSLYFDLGSPCAYRALARAQGVFE
ncbi:MAG: hypothetical protein QOI98_3223, partial [Solirubrobacteraceae bacterium]|nr:hypothetical protein [Solirubrobacteraceae bacterium]